MDLYIIRFGIIVARIVMFRIEITRGEPFIRMTPSFFIDVAKRN